MKVHQPLQEKGLTEEPDCEIDSDAYDKIDAPAVKVVERQSTSVTGKLSGSTFQEINEAMEEETILRLSMWVKVPAEERYVGRQELFVGDGIRPKI